MLSRANIDHLLRAAASICNVSRLVLVGSGAVIATARHIPARMMLTKEVDLYIDGDDALTDQIAGSIGEGSPFHNHFGYYADSVGPNTAVLPLRWRSRCVIHKVAGHDVEAVCPSSNDIAVAKMCAFREKDVAWLREALQSGIAKTATMQAYVQEGMPDNAPAPAEMTRRWSILLAVDPQPSK